jgi:hypothetical protein
LASIEFAFFEAVIALTVDTLMNLASHAGEAVFGATGPLLGEVGGKSSQFVIVASGGFGAVVAICTSTAESIDILRLIFNTKVAFSARKVEFMHVQILL